MLPLTYLNVCTYNVGAGTRQSNKTPNPGKG